MHAPEPAQFAEPMRLRTGQLLVLALGVTLALYVGFRLFWFMTDDAYIAFRYVSNAMAGRGLVWNPAPFVPVEGYTSFLWTILLWGVWSLTGVEPPDAANWLSFVCGLAGMAVVVRLVMTMRMPKQAERLRPYALAFVLLATLTNRTALTWLSSGLETALCNALEMAWILTVLGFGAGRVRPFVPVLCASLIALARPDGLLYVAATLAMLVVLPWLSGERRIPYHAVWPVGLVLLHLTFRYVTYGQLLPNTYYAKHVKPWPGAGMRYMAAFMLEYAYWCWLLVALSSLGLLVRAVRRVGVRVFLARELPLLTVVATLCTQVGYYTVAIGGDHFEFRIFSHLVPLLAISFVWLLAFRVARPLPLLVLCALQLALSWPIPWMHWHKTHELDTRVATRALRVPVADDLPFFLAPVARAWDRLEHWLVKRNVGVRHQEHKIFLETFLAEHDTRAEGLAVSWNERQVAPVWSAGIPGWVAPNVGLIDCFGLSDRVVSHAKPIARKHRSMAHDRSPPPGYLECFFRTKKGQKPPKWLTDAQPVSDARIVDCEKRFAPDRR